MIILIRTANFIYKQFGGYRPFVERECLLRWNARPNWIAGGPPLRAWICRSDWRVDCDICGDNLAAEPGQPFFCPNCLNAANGGLARPVVWPDNRPEIEELLSRRVLPTTRNWHAPECARDRSGRWLPAETIDDLRAEQAAHGE